MILRMTLGFRGLTCNPDLSQLEPALRGGSAVFRDSPRFLTVNQSTPEQFSFCEAVAHRHGWEIVNADDHATDIPEHLMRPQDTRMDWWKYAPTRLAPDDHELWIDNDIYLWRCPEAVTRWLADPTGFLMAGTEDRFTIDPAIQACFGMQHSYGRSTRRVVQLLSKAVGVNAGIVGMPPGYDMWEHVEWSRPDKAMTTGDQAYIACLYGVHDKDHRYLVPFEDVPYVWHPRIGVERLVQLSGVHMGGINGGFNKAWVPWKDIIVGMILKAERGLL